MDDPFDVLDCALRSRYVAPEALPALPVWERLPSELRAGLTHALAAGQPLGKVVPLVWRVRAELHGKPEPDESGERTRGTAARVAVPGPPGGAARTNCSPGHSTSRTVTRAGWIPGRSCDCGRSWRRVGRTGVGWRRCSPPMPGRPSGA
jgi:hypothetical protein